MNLQTRPTGTRLEAVQCACHRMKADHQGNIDADATLKIWQDFKWKCLSQATSVQDIESYLSDAMQATLKIETEVVRKAAMAKLTTMAEDLKKFYPSTSEGFEA